METRPWPTWSTSSRRPLPCCAGWPSPSSCAAASARSALSDLFAVEQSALGRILVPADLAPRTALFYTTRDFDGFLSPEKSEQIAQLLSERFGTQAQLASCEQVHGASIARVKPAQAWRECDSCDALWSSESGVALAIKVADCLPVTILDAERGVVANIHSGWRGAVQSITRLSVETLQRDSHFEPGQAVAYLGPSIRRCCFEVGEEVAVRFIDWPDVVDRSRPKPHVDLPLLTKQVLLALGFHPERVLDSGLCTRCPGSIFHSFRRDGRGGGRNLAIVAR